MSIESVELEAHQVKGEQQGTKKTSAAKISVLSNSTLVVLKLIVGLFTGSVSIISEAVHSGVDLMASLIDYFAVKTSDKAPDKKHAYGHGKIEDISGAIEAVLIIVAALMIVYRAATKLLSPSMPEKLGWGMVLMSISVVTNFFVSRKLFKAAKATSSHALEADALHLQADVLTSLGVLVGLVVIEVTKLYWLDPIIAIVVASIIFKAGFEMTVKSVQELLDIGLSEDDVNTVKGIINEHSLVKKYSRLRTRRSGSTRLVDVNLTFDETMPLNKVHDACNDIEKKIKHRLAPCDVMIHAEPY